MKIVLDTTILVRANEHSRGLARELLISILQADHILLLSNEMLHELARVLRDPRLQAFYGLSEDLVYNYVAFLRHSSEIIDLDPLVTAPIRDVNDVIVMQTAILGEADILCTKDDDFFEYPAGPYLNRMVIARKRPATSVGSALLSQKRSGLRYLKSTRLIATDTQVHKEWSPDGYRIHLDVTS